MLSYMNGLIDWCCVTFCFWGSIVSGLMDGGIYFLLSLTRLHCCYSCGFWERRRKKLNLPGNNRFDFFIHYVLEYCAIFQVYHQVKHVAAAADYDKLTSYHHIHKHAIKLLMGNNYCCCMEGLPFTTLYCLLPFTTWNIKSVGLWSMGVFSTTNSLWILSSLLMLLISYTNCDPPCIVAEFVSCAW